MKKEITLIFITIAIVFLLFSVNVTNSNEIMQIETVFVEKNTIINQVIAKGNIEELNQSYVSINQNGTVKKLNFSLGDKVSKGDIIMTIETDDLQQNQAINSIFELIDNKSIIILNTSEMGEIDIISNVDGVITSISSAVNESIISSIPFLSVCDTENLVARLSISEKNIKDVSLEQEVLITGDSFEGTIAGKITQIMPYATSNFDILNTSSTVTVEVIAELSEFSQNIIVGCSVEAKITVDEKSEAITVPFDAIYQENAQEYVYILQDNTICKREISTGYEISDNIEVTTGLYGDEIIVVSKNVFDGQEVINEK